MHSDNAVAEDERRPLLAGSIDPSTAPDAEQLKPKSPRQGLSVARLVICIITLAILIMFQATNISILTVTSSAISSDLDAFESSSWFTSAYLIAMSSAGPISGKLAHVFTPRISIVISATFVAIGTLITSFADGFSHFVAGRVVTGIGAGGVFIVGNIIILEVASAERRALLIGAMNTLMTAGVSLGATVAGALLPITGWRALFWMQSPVALVCAMVLLTCAPGDLGTKADSDKEKQSLLEGLRRQDYLGAAALTLGIVLMLYAISSPTSIPIAPVLAALVVLSIFIWIELKVAVEPIIPITLLKSRGLLFTCLATVGYMMSRWTILFYTPIYAIAVRGWSPASGGAILIPTNTGFALGGLLVGWLHIRGHGSFYWSSLSMYILFPITLFILSFMTTNETAAAWFILIVFVNGFITGAALNYTFAHLLFLTPKSTHYMTTSIIATFRGFAGSFASAAGGGYFVRMLRSSLLEEAARQNTKLASGLLRRLLGSPALVQSLRGSEKTVGMAGYSRALTGLWQGAAVLAMAFALLQALTGGQPPQVAQDADDETTSGPAPDQVGTRAREAV